MAPARCWENLSPALAPAGYTVGMWSDVQVNFIRTELQTGATMVKLAHTERSILEPEAARHAIANAHTVLNAAKRFLPTVKTCTWRYWMNSSEELKSLRARSAGMKIRQRSI